LVFSGFVGWRGALIVGVQRLKTAWLDIPGMKNTTTRKTVMRRLALICIILLVSCLPAEHRASHSTPAPESSGLIWPGGLPVSDHIVIVVEENKDYEEIIGNSNAPYINNVLKKEGANFVQM
jgi:hypothetical protein